MYFKTDRSIFVKRMIMGKAEETRQYIIEKAAPLFNIKGVEGTSIDDIMVATGLKKGGIYGNFAGGKDEIVVEAYNYLAQKLLKTLGRYIKPIESAEGKLKGILKFYNEFLFDPVIEGGCPILNFGVEVDDFIRKVRREKKTDDKEKVNVYSVLNQRVNELLNEIQTDLERIIKYGIRREEFRPDTDVKGLAELIITMVEGAILVSRLRKNNSALLVVSRSIYGEIERIKV